MRFSSVEIRLPDGASDRRKLAPAEGTPHVVLTGRVVCGSVKVKGPRRTLVRRRGHA